MRFLKVFEAVFVMCLRNRFVALVILFSFFIHYFGLLVTKKATLSFQGVITEVGTRQAMFLSLYLSVATVFFILVAFSIWIVPFFHRGDRALLTFALPVSKWSFPLAYSAQYFLLATLEWAILIISFGLFYGWEELWAPRFSWVAIFQCFSLVVVSTQALLFFLSSFSLLWGPLTTLFIGATGFLGLQVLATLDRIGFLATLAEQGSFFAKGLSLIHQVFPPLGSLVFDLRDTFSKGELSFYHVALWVLWALCGAAFLKWVITRPQHQTISEG